MIHMALKINKMRVYNYVATKFDKSLKFFFNVSVDSFSKWGLNIAMYGPRTLFLMETLAISIGLGHTDLRKYCSLLR